MFVMGLRVDLVTVCYLAGPVAIICLILPKSWVEKIRHILVFYITAWTGFILFLEVGTPGFFAQFDSRPNRLMIEPLFHPREILQTVVTLHWGKVIVISVVMYFLLRKLWNYWDSLFLNYGSWSTLKRLVAFFVVIPLLFLGARNSLAHRPFNLALASFSKDHYVNEITVNSTFSTGYAIYSLRHEMDPAKIYRSEMSEEEIVSRVRKYLKEDGSANFNKEYPFLRETGIKEENKQYNIVVVLEESMGSGFVGHLGGLPLTPCLDRLSEEGMVFTQLYCTGTRTVRGIEATVSSFPPSPGRSAVKLGQAQSNFFTVAELLKRRGYETMFVYGGESHFDNMATFFRGNGFSSIYDEGYFKNPTFHGTWGVSDEDLMREAVEIFKKQKDKPFFALVLSTSNHTPYEFPDGRIELYEEPKASRNNTVKYADYAIGELIRLSKAEEFYKNTIFVILADHDSRAYGNEIVPVKRYHIPAVIIGGPVEKSRYEKVASQMDLLPTVFALAGIGDKHPMLGRNVLALPADNEGRAIIQYYKNNAFIVGDKVVIHQAGGKVEQFRYADNTLVPAPIDNELVKDGMAHAIVTGLLLKNQSHRLPD
jgi:phosphoglycerol transferase MdoB-like AlkP superfamily enzyme